MKLEFNKKMRDGVAATGLSGSIKKDNKYQLKLPELGKLEALTTAQLTDKFTRLWLGDNEDQLSNV